MVIGISLRPIDRFITAPVVRISALPRKAIVSVNRRGKRIRIDASRVR